MYRGFILKAVTDHWGFKTGNYAQAFLFGIWHIVMCVLGVYDGQMSVVQAIVFAIGYVVLAGILAIEWGTCVNMSGVLWVGLSEHFFNNLGIILKEKININIVTSKNIIIYNRYEQINYTTKILIQF